MRYLARFAHCRRLCIVLDELKEKTKYVAWALYYSFDLPPHFEAHTLSELVQSIAKAHLYHNRRNHIWHVAVGTVPYLITASPISL